MWKNDDAIVMGFTENYCQGWIESPEIPAVGDEVQLVCGYQDLVSTRHNNLESFVINWVKYAVAGTSL